MNLFNLTEEDIARLRQEHSLPDGFKSCPHWSAMRPFRWKGEYWVLFRCDDPDPENCDWLGEFPRSRECLVYPNVDGGPDYWRSLAKNVPQIAMTKITNPQHGLQSHWSASNGSKEYSKYPYDSKEYLDELWISANDWVDSVEE